MYTWITTVPNVFRTGNVGVLDVRHGLGKQNKKKKKRTLERENKENDNGFNILRGVQTKKKKNKEKRATENLV